MKGVVVESKKLSYSFSSDKKESFTDFMQQEMGLTLDSSKDDEITEASKMLAPLFGTNSIAISRYPDFFARIAVEAERLRKSSEYLEKRVEMERLGLQKIELFEQPLGCSYKEFIELIGDPTYALEFLFLLTDIFPSQFPHLVLTTSLMEYALHLEGTLVII